MQRIPIVFASFLAAAACSPSTMTSPTPFNFIPPDQRWQPVAPIADVPAPPFVPPTLPPSVPPTVVVGPPTDVVTPTTPGQVPIGTQPNPWTPPSYTPGPNPGGVLPGPSGPPPPPPPVCPPDAPFGPWSPWVVFHIEGSSNHPGCTMTSSRRSRTQTCTGRIETEEKTECV